MVYLKIGDYRYYYETKENMHTAVKNWIEDSNKFSLTLFADVVINTKDQTILKCRYLLEDIFENKVKKVKYET